MLSVAGVHADFPDASLTLLYDVYCPDVALCFAESRKDFPQSTWPIRVLDSKGYTVAGAGIPFHHRAAFPLFSSPLVTQRNQYEQSNAP
jgi:hypothetical protein